MTRPTPRMAGPAFAAALYATTALASPALAQATGIGISTRERQAPDENGVDVITGKMTTSPESITAGPEGEGLTFVRGYAAGRQYDSFNAELHDMSGAACLLIGGHMTCMMKDGQGNFSPRDGDGSTLAHDSANGRYTYTDRNGTVWLFLTAYGDSSGPVSARLRTVTRSNGEIVTYTYKTVTGTARAQSIVNNRGYQLKPRYASDTAGSADFKRLVEVTAINNAVEFCAPAADSCTLTGDWPSLTLETVGAVHNITDKTGQNHVYTLNSGEVVAKTGPGDVIAFSVQYNSDNRVSKLSRSGGIWNYNYTDLTDGRRRTTVSQPEGGEKVYFADPVLRRVTTIRDELGRTTRLAYDTFGRTTSITRPEGNAVLLAYDARGNVTQSTIRSKADADGQRLPNIVTSAVYPATCANPKTCNKPTSTTDARDFTTDYTYSSVHDGMLTATLPAPSSGAVRPQVRYSYEGLQARYLTAPGSLSLGTPIYRLTATSTCAAGAAPACAGTADETRTTVTYGETTGGHNLLAREVTRAAGDGSLSATTRYVHDDAGNLTYVDGPLSGNDDAVRYRFDAARRPVGTILPDPDGAGPLKRRAEQVHYDFSGLQTVTRRGTVDGITQTDWTGFQTLETATRWFDSLGRVSAVSLAGADGVSRARTETSYDLAGRPVCTAVRVVDPPLNAPAEPACEAREAADGTRDRIGRRFYDPAGQLVSVWTGWDTIGARREAAYSYTGNGQVQLLTDAEDNRTSFAYDLHDRLFRTRYPVKDKGQHQTAADDHEELGYDAAGNVTSRKLRDNDDTNAADDPVIFYGYDDLGRMTLKDLPGAEPDTTYAYDNLGQLKSASQPGHALGFVYDALGRLRIEGGPQGNVLSAYDAAGRRTRLTWPDGFHVDYDYNQDGSLRRIRENGETSGAGVLAMFGYDALGRRESLTRGNGTVTNYGYDPVSRLETLTQDLDGTADDLILGFTYNKASQIATNTRSNDAYALVARSLGSTDYETGGLNQLTKIGTAVPSHDPRGNLASDGTSSYTYSSENLLLTGPNGATLDYDPLMRLHRTNALGFSAKQFAYDGVDMIAEYLDTGALFRRYVHGPGMDEPLVWYDGPSGSRVWLHADERGSIAAISDGNGDRFAANRYDEYGLPASGNLGRFQYTGQMWLPEVGLYYYKARMYDPKLPRFLQPDPIGYGDGTNLYRYPTDPINFADPSGMAMDITGSRIPNRVWGIGICGSCSGSSTIDISGNAGGSRDPGGGGGAFSGNGHIDQGPGLYAYRDGHGNLSGFHPHGFFGSSLGPIGSAGGLGPNEPQNVDAGADCIADLQSCIVVVGSRQPKAWINYNYPGFFSHVSARHLGYDYTSGSVFRGVFQNEASLTSLAQFAANNSPLRNTGAPGVYRYTARYTSSVGYLQGSGNPTYLITLIVADTGTINKYGQRVFQPVTLYPGAGLPW